MKKTYLATAVATLFVSSITTAIAADTLLDDVVVSSSRAEQRSFDAPASIQSINNETIQGAGPQVNMSEPLNRVPGVIALNRQNYAQDLQISIRGFGARTKFGVRGVRLIIDGIPATMPDGQGQSSSVSMTSTDRIEVLKGPLAQLYGNSAGGVIQAFTREAPESPEFLIQGFHGSYGTNRTDWQYAQKIEQFSLVADYSTFKTDGYRQNSQTERNQFNGKFSYDHDDKTKISLIANIFDMPYAYDPRGLNATQYASNDPTFSRNLNPKLRKIIEQNQIAGLLEHKFDNLSKISIRYYDGNRKNTHFNSDTNWPNSYGSWVGLDRDYSGFGFDYSTKFNINNAVTSFNFGGSLDRSKEVNTKGSSDVNTQIAANPNLTRNDLRSSKSSDFYSQFSALVLPQYTLTGGFRYSHITLTNIDRVIANSCNNCDSSYATSFDALNPVLGLTYHALENMNIFANYGRGFETPTASELAYKTVNNVPVEGYNSNLSPSKSNHYEIGIKWLPTLQSRIDLAAFYISTKNEIVVDKTVTPESSYINMQGTTRRGVELMTQNRLGPNYRANLSLTYMSAENSSQSIFPGKKLPGVPEQYIFAEFQWSSDEFIKNKFKQIKGTLLGIEFINVSRIYSDNQNTKSLSAPGYGAVNLRASHAVDLDGLSLVGYAQLNNMFDKKYIGSLIVGDSAPIEPAPRKNWILGVKAVTRF